MALIREVAGDRVEAMAPTLQVFGLVMIPVGSDHAVREVQIMGIRPEDRARVGDFEQYLYHQAPPGAPMRRARPSFEVPDPLRLNSPAGQVLQG